MSACIKICEGRYWMPQFEITHNVCPPVTQSQRISMRSNAVLFQNQGNCNVVLDSGLTITPGQSYQFGETGAMNVTVVELTARFDLDSATSEPPVLRLEVCEMQTKFKGSGYYIDTPPV